MRNSSPGHFRLDEWATRDRVSKSSRLRRAPSSGLDFLNNEIILWYWFLHVPTISCLYQLTTICHFVIPSWACQRRPTDDWEWARLAAIVLRSPGGAALSNQAWQSPCQSRLFRTRPLHTGDSSPPATTRSSPGRACPTILSHLFAIPYSTQPASSATDSCSLSFPPCHFPHPRGSQVAKTQKGGQRSPARPNKLASPSISF